MNIKKTLIFLTISLVIYACQSQQGDQDLDYKGSRSFNIDNSKSLAEVSVHGAFMGTPDWDGVRDEVQRFQDSGDIKNVKEHSVGFEGGSTFCFEFSSTGDKNHVYDEFRRLPTDLKETDYSVISLDKCSNSK